MSAHVEVRRGGTLESVHRVHVAVVDARGRLRALAGDPGFATFYRSVAKPMQALPLVEDGVVEALGIPADELALCCASHNSEPRHVDAARRLLARVGLDESALACGGHPPLRPQEGVRLLMTGVPPGPIHSNCSGKHAGMLALAVHHGWTPHGYHRPQHPVQRRMQQEIGRWTGLGSDQMDLGIDGCAVPCFRVPLRVMALSYARFVAVAAAGAPARRIVAVMTAHPGMVAGEGRLSTALVEMTEGRLFVKVGAEGVYAAGVPAAGLGIALKVEDGARRAAGPALLRVLEELDLLSSSERDALRPFSEPDVMNTRGEPVGEVRATFGLRAEA